MVGRTRFKAILVDSIAVGDFKTLYKNSTMEIIIPVWYAKEDASDHLILQMSLLSRPIGWEYI